MNWSRITCQYLSLADKQLCSPSHPIMAIITAGNHLAKVIIDL